MSQPRCILPGITYLITRRVILRHMLLRPDPPMTQILTYLLAVEAQRHGVQVHAVCAMSDHIHLVVTDVLGALPKFLHGFHRAVAFCTKVLRDWNDVVWDKQPTNVVKLETLAAVVDKIAYVLANPVMAGLVARAHEWPGAKTLVDQIGSGALRARRPDVYLDPNNPAWPLEAEIPVVLPPLVAPEHAEDFRAQIAAELARFEAVAHAHRQASSRPVLGADAACQVSPDARAETAEPVLARNPTFAVGRGQGRHARRLAGEALRGFRDAYRAALERWRKEWQSAVFPAGTWWMRVFHHAAVASG